MARTGSVQRQYGAVLAAKRGVLVLKDGRCRAVLEVTGYPVASAPPTEQDDYRAASERFASALAFPVQFVVRAEAVDLAGHAAEIEERVRDDAVLAPLAADYAAFCRRLAAERLLLRRRCFLVLPAEPGLRWRAVRHQLTERADQTAKVFTRMGMPARRLRSADLLRVGQALYRPGSSPVRWSVDPDDGDAGAWVADPLARSRAQDALDALAPARRPTWRERARSWRVVPRRWRRPLPADDPRRLEAEADLVAGTDGYADRVAPERVFHTRGTVRLVAGVGRAQQEACRVFYVTGYPSEATIGWLTPLLRAQLTVDVSLHVAPREKDATVHALDRQINRLQGRQLRVRRGEAQADPDEEEALKQLVALRRSLKTRDDTLGRQRLFDAGFYLRLRAPTVEELGDEQTGAHARLEQVLRDLGLEWRVALYEQPEGMVSCDPVLDDRLSQTRVLDTSTVARSIPFCAPTGAGEGVLAGTDSRDGSAVLHNAFGAANLNASCTIAAPPGSGKSYAAKLWILRHLYLGADVLVVDPEGEYRRLCRAVGDLGALVRFGEHPWCSHINLLDLPPVETDLDTGATSNPVREQVIAAGNIIEAMLTPEKGPAMPDEQRAAIDRAITLAYHSAGISAEDVATWKLPAPLLRDVLAGLRKLPGPSAKVLAEKLALYAGDGGLAPVFDRATDVDLSAARLQVFDVKDAPQRARPALMYLLLQAVWRLARRERRPRLLVADEAASILRRPDGAAFLAELARRGRKWWLGLVVMVQDLSQLEENQAGVDVLRTSASRLLLHHRADAVDLAVRVFKLSKEERDELLAAGPGEGLFLTGGDRIPLRVERSEAEHLLATTQPDEVARLEAEERARRVTGPTPLKDDLADAAG